MNYLLFLFTVMMSNVCGSPLPGVTSIIIDKPGYTVYCLTAEGDTVAKFPCALGRNYGQKTRTGDNKTPEGNYKIQTIYDSHSWEGDASGSDYGPWFMRLIGNDGWTDIGIHGTNRPESIGSRASLGCIRLHNGDLELLYRMIKPGCDVTILPDSITTNHSFPDTPTANKSSNVKKTEPKRSYRLPVRKHKHVVSHRRRNHK